MTDDLGNTLYKRGTYFPNVNTGAGNYRFPQAPGVAEGQARIAQLQAQGSPVKRGSLTMVNSPYGGSMGVKAGQLQKYLDKGYTVQQTPRTPVQQFDINQAYAQGYGAPSPTIQQGPGGPYRVAGGVASPYTPQNAFQRFGSNFTAGINTIGTLATNALSGIGRAANTAMQYNPFNPTFNYQTGQYRIGPQQTANPGANATPTSTPNTGPDSQYFAYNPSPLQPRRFDFNYF